MARWDPGAQARLQEAALDLYEEHGYEHVTSTQIAERAGLTRRSFFRYFADKREVLFGGSERLAPALAEAVRDAGTEGPPLAAALEAVARVGDQLVEELGDVRRVARRRAVIAASPELRERERTKLADVASALAGALAERGTDAASAVLLGQVATVAFQTAFERWVAAGGTEDFATHLEDVGRALRASL